MEQGESVSVESEAGPARRTPSAANKKKKVVRRDPDKRRLQNRLAQKTYREKQRKRIQELERRADAPAPAAALDPVPSLSTDLQVAVRSSALGALVSHDGPPITVDPLLLQAASPPEAPWDDAQDLLTTTPFDWPEDPSPSSSSAVVVPPVIFFHCGCPTLHIPAGATASVLLPVIPDPRMNTLRIDTLCSVQALIENCRQVGITRAMFCSEDAVSPFFRPRAESPAAESPADDLVAAVQRGFRGLHYDLRPTRTQVLANHHPFIDAIPIKDVRDNLIRYQDEIDEDDFFHDSLNHMTCWGSVKGAHTGSPWDGRSWEASEMFLQKWWLIVGGEDGELTRQSRWWRALRGERVTEIL